MQHQEFFKGLEPEESKSSTRPIKPYPSTEEVREQPKEKDEELVNDPDCPKCFGCHTPCRCQKPASQLKND